MRKANLTEKQGRKVTGLRFAPQNHDGWSAIGQEVLTIGGEKGMSQSVEELHEESLDQEWMHLLLTARQMGIPLEEIRAFFRESSPK